MLILSIRVFTLTCFSPSPPGGVLRQGSAEFPLIEREFCDGWNVAVDGEPAEERKPRVRGDSGVRQRRVE